MAKLLVSVRSAVEAQAAVAGGAAIVDVKEPSQGPLGRASIFRLARGARHRATVDTGERCSGRAQRMVRRRAVGYSARSWSGVGFCKLGLSHAPPNWSERWQSLRRRLGESTSPSLAWVAVVYTDWQSAQAPDPDAVIEAATAMNECRGVLFDTCDKSRGTEIDDTWKARIARGAGLGPVRRAGRLARCRRDRAARPSGARHLRRERGGLSRRRSTRGDRSGASSPAGEGGERLDGCAAGEGRRSHVVVTSNRTPWARGSPGRS